MASAEVRPEAPVVVNDPVGSSDVAASPAAPLASVLAGKPTAFVNADVALDGESVVGSFTVDGLIFALAADGLALVSVGASAVSDDGAVSIPSTASYDGAEHFVTAIGAYAFYLSGTTSVALPEAIASIDARAFRSSDVARVEAVEGNPSYASFDGCLYDSQLTRLLLIPGGRQGAVRIAQSAEEVEASAFSHCAGVDSISVDAGSAAYASWDGLLYDADGMTLLRVPAGATEVAIREGCTTIAAGAMEGCAKLERISAPASVASISPDVFSSVPTVSLPAAALATEASEAAGPAPQLTALVALSSGEGSVSDVDPKGISVVLADDANGDVWRAAGFTIQEAAPEAQLQDAESNRAYELQLYANGGRMQSTQYPGQSFTSGQSYSSGDSIQFYSNASIYYFLYTITYSNPGCTFNCYSLANSYAGSSTRWTSGTRTMTSSAYVIWNVPITWNANGGYWGSNPSDTANKSNTWTSNYAAKGWNGSSLPQRPGYRFTGWKNSSTGAVIAAGKNVPVLTATTYIAQWEYDYTIHFEGNVVDDEAHPATVPADMVGARDLPVVLPEATRFGYIFRGWATHPSGTTANGHKVFAPGESVVNLASTSGETVTLYALWTLKYDANVPVCAPADMTFALDATGTGDIKAVPADYAGDFSPADMDKMGSTHAAAIESRMAVPVAVSSVSAAAISDDSFSKVLSSTDGGAPERQLAFAVASGDAKASVHAGESADLEGLLVPEASEATPVAKLSVSYGLALEPTAVVLAADGQAAVPVAQVSYTLDVIEGMAAKWGFFINDAGTPVPPSRIKEAANDIAANDKGDGTSASDWYLTFKEYLDSDTKGYVAWGDGATYAVRIIGINHDSLASAVDGRSKAGLTLQFVDLLNDMRPMNPTNTNLGGWEASSMRSEMQSGEIWDQVPAALKGIVETVGKLTHNAPGSSGDDTVTTTDDSLFLLSQIELAQVSTWAAGHPWTEKEGSPYPYWTLVVEAEGAIARSKGLAANPSAPIIWWQRTVQVSSATTGFSRVRADGAAGNFDPASLLKGVCPAFCV